ncbi:MAG: GNAT family N-acetyltransferase [Paracoccaceae bacterium]|nr:GNAT family N-acetyltransferase [Paracoccaceae bacterium]
MDALGGIVVEEVHALTPEVATVLQSHFDLMRSQSPAESCHVMQPDALYAVGSRVFVARQAGRVLGIAALKPLGAGHGELKSMHTLAEARGKGVAQRILDRLLQEAEATGYTRLSLETGSAAAFTPARQLYAKAGFAECPPFGDYVTDPLSLFMTRTL